METINNLTAAATKAVWGDNETGNKEPVSGVKGDTARGEPYDAGNLGMNSIPALCRCLRLIDIADTSYSRNTSTREGST